MFDLGYGSGNWLLMMSELGYRNLHGYDIDANTENASRLLGKGVEVSNGRFLENSYREGSFDCVRLDHVFEHLHEPVQVLNKCWDMLKPGGYLLMSLPCKNSWSMKLSLVHSPALQLPKHLFHHTQASARLLLENTGFEILKIQAYSVASQLAGTINETLAARQTRPIPPVLFEMLAPAYKLFSDVTKKGDFMTVWVKKLDS
ncbi:MAG: putative SAM-dependent methyltransferase [Acidobacteria bacterium]|nr:putative SAM-dependent methyltransferase [Acidobacteriota bacterium]